MSHAEMQCASGHRISKHIVGYNRGYPDSQDTSLFGHNIFFSSLTQGPLLVLFVRYIASAATVEGAKLYPEGHENIPVWIKWPNDIHIEEYGTARGRIIGISSTASDLLVQELGNDNRLTDQAHGLGPDGNSIDFFHRLLKSKTS
ncbi:hypothetical protein NUW58_g6850 [Xylaria curta]|uniref:Uncharacterized protein n=1 Tax=Xylaria curta TaxID=42375 RepID=A0ACC1NNF5_9PEZI|nr:hypothetical protein NUW58_g6850 [Xylaria curta]